MKYSVTNQRWSLCILASFIGFFFLAFYHDQGLHLVTIVASLGSLGSNDNYTVTITTIGGTQSTTLLPPQNGSSLLPELSPKPVVQEKVSTPKLNKTNEIVSLHGKRELSLKSKKPAEKCDIFDGEWVYDPKSYPLYRAQQCPFLSDQVTCQRNGRPDSDYERWRWKPRGCETPRFNGTQMMERLKGKRFAIIGDSLDRNQWESLACLLYSSIHSSRAIVKLQDSYKIFRALDYDFTLEFFWTPFLTKQYATMKGSKVLKLNELEDPIRWQGADFMVFNTGHWWTHTGRTKTWDYYEDSGKLVKEMEGHSAFQTAMKTWAQWIDQTVNVTKTSVFFRSISPDHRESTLHWCYNQIQPITNETYRQSFPETMVFIVEQTIRQMRTPVKYLNITRLSEYRRDAHTSLYTTKQKKLLTEDEKRQPHLYADCSHWCLPGLPDTWNVLLYASIIRAPSIVP